MTESASDSGNKPKAPEPKSPTAPLPHKAGHAVIFSRSMLKGSYFYPKLLELSVLAILCTIGLFAWDFYARTHKPVPPYYAVSSDDQLIRLTPLRNPNLTSEALLRWAAEAATSVFSFDFYNYAEVNRDSRVFFTKPGYENFLAAIKNAGIVDTIVKKRLVVSAVLTNTPVIIKEGVISTGFYAWQVQLPMLLTYQSASEQIKSRIILTLLVTRVPTSESSKGVGIASFIVTETGRGRT